VLYRKDEKQKMVCTLFTRLGEALVVGYNVPKVLVGTGGNTPKKLGQKTTYSDFFSRKLPYSDAYIQRLVAEKNTYKM